MNFSFPKKNISFYNLITFLIIPLIPFSKTTNINPVIFNNINNLKEFPWDDFEEIEYLNLKEKCEKLEKSIKDYEEDIKKLVEENQNSNLQIELNKVYVKILYALIIIFVFIIIVIIIFKFYFQCTKKQNIVPNIYLRENNYLSSQENNNINNN